MLRPVGNRDGPDDGVPAVVRPARAARPASRPARSSRRRCWPARSPRQGTPASCRSTSSVPSRRASPTFEASVRTVDHPTAAPPRSARSRPCTSPAPPRPPPGSERPPRSRHAIESRHAGRSSLLVAGRYDDANRRDHHDDPGRASHRHRWGRDEDLQQEVRLLVADQALQPRRAAIGGLDLVTAQWVVRDRVAPVHRDQRTVRP